MRAGMMLAAVGLLWAATPVLADWDVGDGHKMHYPQLPDPNGWDVYPDLGLTGTPVTEYAATADDWQCWQSGPVNDIHFWYSVQGDYPSGIPSYVRVTIYSNNSSGPGGYSQPLDVLWDRTFYPPEYSTRLAGTGDQGWLDPDNLRADLGSPVVIDHDHQSFFQLNIESIVDPFLQVEGTIYWLAIHMHEMPGESEFGWKTSTNHFEDDAVYWSYDGSHGSGFYELRDPHTNESLDFAFVITPEPATLSLLALGGLALLRRRR